MDLLNGPFLVAAAAAAVPVIIHLVQRRRVRSIVFGSLRVLRKTSHRVVHKRRFAELLLVILRALALAVVAAAFARPFFRTQPRRDAEGTALLGQEAVLVLIDNSYSMRAEGRLERARREALEFLRDLDPASKVGVAVYSSRFEERCPIGSGIDRAEEAVRDVKPSWRGSHLAVALRQADRVLTRADRKEAYRRIVLIGDFAASSWQERGDWTLSAGVELAIRNVARKTVPNVFIARLAVPRLVVAGGFVEVISATVRNLTDQPLSGARVSFRVGGERKAVQSVNLRPGEEAPVRFRHEFTEPGDVIGSIAVGADDPLPDDNVAHFCVHVTPRVHVLLVNADGREENARNDGLFVRKALVPGVAGLTTSFDVREIAPQRMAPGDLDGIDVVLFLNVSTLPAAMTRPAAGTRDAGGAALSSPLGRFLAGGGGIGFVCGSKVVPAEFNRTFAGLLPCRLLRRAMKEGDPPVAIDQIDLRHEIFAPFARPHSGDFSLAKFRQYFLVTDSLRARVPARFSSRDAHPVFLERAFAQGAPSGEAAAGTPGDGRGPGGEPVRQRLKGKSILLVSSLDLEWNTLCLKSVFVPFVHQLTKRLCARGTHQLRNFIVADEIIHHLPAGADAAKLRRAAQIGQGDAGPRKPGRAAQPVSRPSVPRWTEPVELKARAAALRSEASGPKTGAKLVSFSPDRPGIYELNYEGGSARFAINLDPREPDLRPLDTRLLLTAVQRRKGPRAAGDAGVAVASASAAREARERVEARQKLWRYLLIAALAVLALEMLLAWRIGRA